MSESFREAPYGGGLASRATRRAYTAAADAFETILQRHGQGKPQLQLTYTHDDDVHLRTSLPPEDMLAFFREFLARMEAEPGGSVAGKGGSDE